MTAQTYLNSHKAEMPQNHWVFVKDEAGGRLPTRLSVRSRPPLTHGSAGLNNDSGTGAQPQPSPPSVVPPPSSNTPPFDLLQTNGTHPKSPYQDV